MKDDVRVNVQERSRPGATVVVAYVSLALAACGSSQDAATAARAKAACYPACLADVVARCPLVTQCTGGPEPDPTVARAGESVGAAACYASGERVRATVAGTTNLVYVEADDGTACYTVSSTTAAPNQYTITVGGQVVATIDDAFDVDQTATVACGGMDAVVDESGLVCMFLPWQAHGCGASTTCSFGPNPPPDAGGQ